MSEPVVYSKTTAMTREAIESAVFSIEELAEEEMRAQITSLIGQAGLAPAWSGEFEVTRSYYKPLTQDDIWVMPRNPVSVDDEWTIMHLTVRAEVPR